MNFTRGLVNNSCDLYHTFAFSGFVIPNNVVSFGVEVKGKSTKFVRSNSKLTS